jgi:hypothetical protein
MHAQELVRDLMRSTPNLPALNGNGCFLPTGASVGWDCEKIELRTAESRSNRGAVTEHLRLRQWVYDTVQELNSQNGAYTTVEMSCGGACYATGKTFGTHFNVDIQLVNRPAISQDLAALYLIGLPFHGSGALKFGTIVPCWSAHIEQRGVQRLFGFKDMRDAGRCRLQIATSAGCSRSPLSLALGFGWLTLIAAALEGGLSSAEIPQFNDVEAAGRTYNTDLTANESVETSMGALSVMDCIELVLPVLCTYANTEDLSDICALLGRVIHDMRKDPSALATSHDPHVLCALVTRLAARRGFDAEQLREVNSALISLDHSKAPDEDNALELPAFLLRNHRRLRNAGGHTTREGRLNSVLDEETLERYIALKSEAEELYTRWPVLGHGLFDELDRAGVLEYARFGITLPEPSDEISAFASPRAWLRGGFVAEYSKYPGAYTCGWDRLVDKEKRATLTMSDPDRPESEWKPLARETENRPGMNRLRRALPVIDRYLNDPTHTGAVSTRARLAQRTTLPVNGHDERTHRFSPRDRVNCHATLPLPGSAETVTPSTIDLLRRRADQIKSGITRMHLAVGLWVIGEIDEAARQAHRACRAEWFLPAAQEILVVAAHRNPCREGFVPELEELMRRWTLLKLK